MRPMFSTILLLLGLLGGKEGVMDGRIMNAGGFDVVGVTVRTQNRDEMGPNGRIGQLWQQVYGNRVLDRIPNKPDNQLVAVYYDYEKDRDGFYSYVIGVRFASIAQVPDKMVRVHVPAGRYAVFTTDRGPVASVIVETWKRIWSLKREQAGGDRAYRADYEVYDERTLDPANAQVDVYVGINQ